MPLLVFERDWIAADRALLLAYSSPLGLQSDNVSGFIPWKPNRGP